MLRRTEDVQTARKVPFFAKHLSMMVLHAKLMLADTCFRVDVALLRNGKPVSGIEVRDTHPVDDAKWEALAELGFPCIEVESKDVIYMWEYDLKSLETGYSKTAHPDAS